jgi:hypothetical protein
VRIKIELLDSNNNAIFTWRPTSSNIARGLRKAAEVAVEKMGIDLEKEGLSLIRVVPESIPADPDYLEMMEGAMHAGKYLGPV